MDREAFDTWLGRVILGLVVAVLMFGPLAFGAVRPSEFIVLQWLVLGASAVWLVRIWLAPKFRFLMPPTAWAVLPFVFYAVWRYQASDIEYLARQEFVEVLLAAALFLLIVNNLYGQAEIRIIVVSLVALGTFVAMYGIYQWMTGSQSVWQFTRPGYEGRGSGTYICPNHLAGFLEMICPLAIALTVFRGFGGLPRIFFAYASLVMLVGIAATGSRGGWLATAVAMTVFILVLVRKKTHLWAALGILLVVGTTGKWFYSRVLEPRIYQHPNQSATDDMRLRIWASAKQMWRDHPWVGVGPNHFDYRYRGYRRPHYEVQSRPGRVHNDYWNTLADWGLIGLTFVMLPIGIGAAGVFLSWKHLHRSAQGAGTRAAVVLGGSIGLIGLLVHSFFDFNLHIPANSMLAAAILALIAAHWRFASQRFWLTARWPVRIGATLILIALGAYLGHEGVTRTKEVIALRHAEKFPVGSPERAAALKAAWEIDRRNGETAYEAGEDLRLRAWAGEAEDYRALTTEAITWFERAAILNKWDPYPHIRMGMCFDWIDEYTKAEPHFRKALELDPNHWYSRAMMGWHYFQAEQWAEVEPWMKRSLELRGHENSLAYTYLDLAKKRLEEERRRRQATPQ